MQGIFKRLRVTIRAFRILSDLAWYLVVIFVVLGSVIQLTTPPSLEFYQFSTEDIKRSQNLQDNNVKAGDYIEITKLFPEKEYGNIIRAEDMPLVYPENLSRIFNQQLIWILIFIFGYLLARWIVLGSVIPLRSVKKTEAPSQ